MARWRAENDCRPQELAFERCHRTFQRIMKPLQIALQLMAALATPAIKTQRASVSTP
jgi:hypothetical protein